MRNIILYLIAFISFLVIGINTGIAQPMTLTRSNSQVITQFNSVSCNYGAANNYWHAENSYYRVFDLPAMGVNGDCFEFTSIEVGIEQATATSSTQPVNIRLYSLTGTMSTANLTLITSQTFNLSNQVLTVYSFPFSYVLSPANITLVVEINTPDGLAGGNAFFIGSNTLGETSPGYLKSAPCGIADPLTLAAVGFPSMHIVMNVKGNNLFTPVAPSSFTMFRDTVCEGSTGVTYSVAPVAGNPTYVWSYSGTGATINGTGNSVNLNFSSSATPGILSVHTTNACGTSSTLSRAIEIDDAVTFPITPSNPEICLGDTITLTAHGGVSYDWEPPTGLDTLKGAVVRASPALSHSYTVTGDDGFGCTGTGTVFVTVHPLPTVGFTPENIEVCAGTLDTIVLNGAATYVWLPTTGLTLSATGDTAIVNLNATTTYTIQGVSVHGCESSTAKTVNVNPIPTPIITFDGNRLLSAPLGYTTYMWYVDGLPVIPIAWQHLYNIKREGLYHVVVTDSNGCEGISNVIDTRTTNIGEFSKNNVRIFPNPATNTINIESPVDVNVRVLTLEGRMVLIKENAKNIDISSLSNGIYFLEITEPESAVTIKEKIIKSE